MSRWVSALTVHEKLARCKWAMSGRKLQGSRRLTLSGLETFRPAVLQTAFILRHKHTVVTQDHKGPEVEENCVEWEGKWSYLSQCSCGVSENFNGICCWNYKKHPEAVYARLHLKFKIVIMKAVVYLRSIKCDGYSVGFIYIGDNEGGGLWALLWKVELWLKVEPCGLVEVTAGVQPTISLPCLSMM